MPVILLFNQHRRVVMKYQHLTLELRYQIYAFKQAGFSKSEIAKKIGVHKSTIGRELRRNLSGRGYRPQFADNQAQVRKKMKAKPRISGQTWTEVEEKINQQWSPEQISGRRKRGGLESVSHERIYQHIYADKAAGGTLYTHLRCQKKKRARYAANSQRGRWTGIKRIDTRPDIVAEKNRIGDWELDTMIGSRHQGAMVTMVDRQTKLLRMEKLARKTADLTKAAICKQLNNLTVHTLTSDNGREFAEFAEIEKQLQAEFYFANPYHSWERGVNENTNGLVRQYFPKLTNFARISDEEVSQVVEKLNNRPRKTLGYKTPNELFFKEQKEQSKVALTT
jgi:IS30 family transposase